MPTARIPEWFDHRCEGAVLSFWIRNNFPVATFQFINSTYMEKDTKPAVKLQLLINGVEVFDMVISGSYGYKCHSYFLHLGTPISMILETNLVYEWNYVEFKVAEELQISSHDIVIKECGVFVFKTERNMEDIRFECPNSTKSTRHEPRDIMGNLQNLRTEKRYEFESESSNNIVVGLEPCIEEVISLLDIPSNRTVCMLGIYGIDGIGKTTLVKALYNSIIHQFDYACYLFDVRETSNQGKGLVSLQETMLSKMLGLENVKFNDVSEGSSVIKCWLHNKRVLLVLDDVDCQKQLKTLAGSYDWFGSGSRIIVTTRDKYLLHVHGVEKTYQMKKLNDHEALELFCWKAFHSSQPPKRFVHLSNEIVTYAKGLPLALEVIGSNLYGKDLEQCECALSQYKRIPNKSVQDILRISYDGLEFVQKDIFLDIACFFKGYRLKDVAYVFVSNYQKYDIQVLVDKSLITVDEFGHVQMHDLIQAMGQEIVRKAAPKMLERRSRLWLHEDIIRVLEENLGTSKLEGIMLDSPEEKIHWNGKALRKMKNLRILIVQNGHFSIGPKYLPNNLCFLEWHGYPSTSLPPNFDPKKLIVLNMPHSCLKLENLSKKFTCVRVMNFSYCQFITEVPDMSGVKNLTKLNLSYCKNLVKVHDSVGFLTKVTFLSFECCTNLANLPTSLQMTSLERLNIKDCTSLQSFPAILVNMDCLKEINATNTAIKELPDSISNLKRFLELQLSGYNIVSIPRYIKQLSHLGILFVINWKKLQQISEIPLDFNLHAKACTSLTLKSSTVLWSQANLELSSIILVISPAAKIPEHYDHRCEGAVLSLWVRKKFPVAVFTFINSTHMEKDTMSAVKLQIFINGVEVNFDMVISGSYGYKCHSCYLHFETPIAKVLETYLVDEWNYVEFKVTDYLQMSSNDIVIEECGVFMLKNERNREDVRFQCPNPPMSSRMVPRHALKRGATLDPGCEPPKKLMRKHMPRDDTNERMAPKTISNEMSKNLKVDWSEKNTDIFVKICVEEVCAGNRPNTHFNKKGWTNLIQKFFKETNLPYKYKHLKNKWDHLEKEWALWVKLIGKETSLAWDPIKKTIMASNDWWEAKIQENPDVGKFREHGPKYLTEMEILFKDVVATRFGAWAPSKDPQDEVSDEVYEERNTNDPSNGNGLQDEFNEGTTNACPSTQSPKRKGGGKVEKGVYASCCCDKMDQMLNDFDSSNNCNRTNVPDITTCLDMLKDLSGVEYGSELFYLGVRLMSKKTNRETFVGLKDPVLQLGWLKTYTMANVARH